MSQQNPSRPVHSIQGPMLAVFLVFVVLASSWLFMQRRWWMPQLASIHGAAIDRVFLVTLTISGVLFILLQGILAYFTFRYGDKQGDRARYWIRPRLEKEVRANRGHHHLRRRRHTVRIGRQRMVSQTWQPAPEGTPVIEVMGEQFAWNFRYPGPDGAFGKTDPSLITSTNPFGIDQDGSAAKPMTSSRSTICICRKASPSVCAFVLTTSFIAFSFHSSV